MAEQKRKGTEIELGQKSSPEPKQKLRRLRAFCLEPSEIIFEEYPEYKNPEQKDDFKTPEKKPENTYLSGTGSGSSSASGSRTTESPADSLSSGLSSVVSDALFEVLAELPLLDADLDFSYDAQGRSY